MNCPNCGKKVEDDAIFCSFCATPLNQKQKTVPAPKIFKPMRITAGILTIISACLAIVSGIFYLIAAVVNSYDYYYDAATTVFYLITAIICILAFAFGLTSGIFAIRKKHLPVTVFGMSWLIASGILAYFSSVVLWSAISRSCNNKRSIRSNSKK